MIVFPEESSRYPVPKTDLLKAYDPSKVEDRWYQHWLDKNYFHASTSSDKEPYTIVIPPPNVTGMLTMGHVLNNTIQEILIRKARMEGKNVCWIPGTDHASIATETKVVSMLESEGIDIKSLTRLIKIKVQAIKISSGLATNFPLIKEIIKKKLPIIISTGFLNMKDLHELNNFIPCELCKESIEIEKYNRHIQACNAVDIFYSYLKNPYLFSSTYNYIQ